MALKGIVHPKMKIFSSFTQPHMVTNLEDILEMFFVDTMKVKGLILF